MPTQATHVWRPSTARLLVLDAFVPVARGTSPTISAPLSWPVKDPADVLDYQFDATAVLLGNEGDGIVTLDARITPSANGGLNLISAAADGSRAVLWLSGGLAGQTYTVTISLTTESGRVISRDVLLPVLQLSTPPGTADLVAGGAPITTNNGSPITAS